MNVSVKLCNSLEYAMHFLSLRSAKIWNFKIYLYDIENSM